MEREEAIKILAGWLTALRKIDIIIDEDVVKFSPIEAVGRLKAYEEKAYEEKITIGDEVNAPGFHVPVVVVASYDDSVKVMNSFGDTGVHPKINVTKTGRHFPELSELFKAMQEGKE